MAHDCPDGKTIKAKGNKPPRVTFYHIRIKNMEELCELAETMASIEELHVGAVTVQVLKECISDKAKTSRFWIGDFSAKQAMTLLESMCLYPGDDLEDAAEKESHFLVYQIEGGQH